MDVAFHGLTGLVISRGLTEEYLLSGLAFSVLPDILGTTAFQFFKVKNASKDSLESFIKDFWKYTKQNNFFSRWDKLTYRTTHTLFSLPFIALFANVLLKDIWWVLVICYLSHFLIDILTHEGEFAFRPFWPFSDWNIKGKNWAVSQKLFLGFWGLLLGIFLFQFLLLI